MAVLAVASSLGSLAPAVTFEHLDQLSELHRAGRYLSGARQRLGHRLRAPAPGSDSWMITVATAAGDVCARQRSSNTRAYGPPHGLHERSAFGSPKSPVTGSRCVRQSPGVCQWPGSPLSRVFLHQWAGWWDASHHGGSAGLVSAPLGATGRSTTRGRPGAPLVADRSAQVSRAHGATGQVTANAVDRRTRESLRCWNWRHLWRVSVLRGDVYELRLRKGMGNEQRGRRFGVIVQADVLLPRSVVLMAPTSTSARPASFRPELVVEGKTTRVLVEQVGAVDVDLLGDPVGHASAEEIWGIDESLRAVLGVN